MRGSVREWTKVGRWRGAWVCWLWIGLLPAATLAQGGAVAVAQPSARGQAQVHVQGVGASFPSRVYQRWAERYEAAHPGRKVSYTPTGSGDGVRQIKARKVHLGGTDVAQSPASLEQARLVQVPMLVGGLVPVVNLPGVGDNQLVLDGAVLADLFLQRIQRWDDARIAALNPGLRLPALPVQRVVRQDASGSTEMLMRYLAESSATFRQALPVSQLPAWPGQVLQAKGNDGIATMMRSTPGGLSYVSFDRVRQDRLSGVRLKNAAGRVLAASEAGFRAAILASDLYARGDDGASLVNVPRPDAWPITATSFVLLDAAPADMATAEAVTRFVYWCFMHGDDLTRNTGFAPLPSRLQARLAARLMQVQGPDGQVPRFSGF